MKFLYLVFLAGVLVYTTTSVYVVAIVNNLVNIFLLFCRNRMSFKLSNAQFKKRFPGICKETLNWFPGHMKTAMADMQRTLKQVDCVLEVHDARIPITGRDPTFFKRIVGNKPHILIMNKKDLVDLKFQKTVESMLIEQGISSVVFTNCKNQKCRGLRKIVPIAIDSIQDSNRYNRAEQRDLKLMVVGIPNVGKSSIINALRAKILHKGRAAPIGGIAGITRAVQELIRINQEPPVYLIDTPGILSPQVSDMDAAMRLALCSCVPDHNVGIEFIADYALYFLNRHNRFDYVKYFELSEPTDTITSVLTHIATLNNKFKKIKSLEDGKIQEMPDFKFAAYLFVSSFREGKLGHFFVDYDFINTKIKQYHENQKENTVVN